MTFQALNSGTTQPTDDLDHLINLLALIARATRKEYGLSEAQSKALVARFFKIHDAYPEIRVRVIEACNEDRRFWQQPADTQLKYLHSLGLLVDTLGV